MARKKSINDINAQYQRIHDSYLELGYRDVHGKRTDDTKAVLRYDQLRKRLNNAADIRSKYLSNIRQTGQFKKDNEQTLKELFAHSKTYRDAQNKELGRKYSQSVYMGTNNG